MKIIDLHQDLMSHIRYRKKFGQSLQTDFDMLNSSDVDLVIATAFPLPKDDDQLLPQVNQLIEEELVLYNQYCEMNDDWVLVRSGKDLDLLHKKLLLHIEGLNVFSGSSADWSRLEHWYGLGLRSLAIHWNIDNDLGAGTLNPEGGLTDLGREVIKWVEDKMMLLDFAHMGRQTFCDAAEIVSRPLYVSHGNADVLCQNVRNYTDDQLRLIAQSGGVIGVFAPNTFVIGQGARGTVDDLVQHILYIRDLIGIKHVAIGSDLGGIVTGDIEGFGSVQDYQNLIESMYVHGLRSEEVEQILYTNARRIVESHLG